MGVRNAQDTLHLTMFVGCGTIVIVLHPMSVTRETPWLVTNSFQSRARAQVILRALTLVCIWKSRLATYPHAS